MAAGCLIWLFHNLPIDELLRSLAAVRWEWVVSAAALALAAYLCVGWEWQLMLQAIGPISFWRSTQAVMAGRFANDALPVHAGYIVRAFLAARWMSVSIAAIAPSLIVERLCDGFWLTAGICMLSLIIPLPKETARARNVLGAAVLAGLAATALVLWWRRLHGHSSPPDGRASGLLARCRRITRQVVDGMRDLVHLRRLPAVLALAFLKLAVQAGAILALLRACGIGLSITEGLAVFAAGYLALCVPSTPAGGGVFQVLVAGMLASFGLGRPEAAAFSLLSFFILTIPPAAAGFFALARSGVTLRQIQREAAAPDEPRRRP